MLQIHIIINSRRTCAPRVNNNMLLIHIHDAVNSGCLSRSDEVGLSSVFTSRHLKVRSFKAGLEKGGRGGGEEA